MKKATTAVLLVIFAFTACNEGELIKTYSTEKESATRGECVRNKQVMPHEGREHTGHIWQHIAKNWQHAQETELLYGVPACISLAQSILESGAGTSPLGKRNNFFGHRAFPRDEAHYYTGGYIKTDSGSMWRVYDTPEQAYLEHGRFFAFTRQWDSTRNEFQYPYKHLLRRNWHEWIKSIHIYAGEPTYGLKIRQIINDYCLMEYNMN